MKENIFRLIRVLTDNDVKFVICGGVACFLHGVERLTIDLDISISMSAENVNNLSAAAKELGLIPRVPEPVMNLLDAEKREKWIKEKNALVYTLISGDSLDQIDIFLRYPKTFEELYQNADIINIKGIDVAISSKEDLIFAKSLVKPLRYKDEWDIHYLKNIIDGKDEVT